MKDRILTSMKDGFLVIWEEIARDGAQAKTLLSADKKVEIARRTGNLFGNYGPDHVIFAAGYPSIGKEEFEAVCQLSSEVDNCSLATHGRMLREDIDIGLRAMNNAAYGRVSFAVPISEEHSQTMLHQSSKATLAQGIALARYALDRSNGIPIDIALGGASDVAPSFFCEAALALFEEGVATIKYCDSAGKLFPLIFKRDFSIITNTSLEEKQKLGVHLHNDLGFALTNNLEAIKQGVRIVATSWLGLAERIGLAPTEQLLFVLSFQEHLFENTGIKPPLWKVRPDLKKLYDTSQYISKVFQYPLRSTDPVISPYVNQIGTGAYFNNPKAFKPFDSEKLMGVPQELVLTHLANKKILLAVANELGIDLKAERIGSALEWVKRYAYENQVSEVPKKAFAEYLHRQ